MGVGAHSYMDADVTARHVQFRAIGGPVGHAALRLETGRATYRSRTAQDASAKRYIDGRAWVVRAGWACWMGRTHDARKEIAFPTHLGGAGRAHV